MDENQPPQFTPAPTGGQPLNTPPVIHPDAPVHHKAFVFIAIAVVLVLGAGVGYAFYKNQKNVIPDYGVPQAAQNETEDPTADWKTYRNEEYGFEIRHPLQYELALVGERSGIVAYKFTDSSVSPSAAKVPSSFSIRIINPATINYKDLGGGVTKYDSQKQQCYRADPAGEKTYQTEKLGEYALCTFYTGDAGTSSSNYYVIIDAQTAIAFNTGSDQVQESAPIEEILSTFKFVGVNSIEKDQKIISTAKEIISLIRSKDYKNLEEYTSSSGLTLSPYPYIDLKKNHSAKSNISDLANDRTIYLFGYTDGKGDPINSTTAAFLESLVNKDYTQAPEVAVNRKLGGTNPQFSLSKDVAPRDFVAFHFPSVSTEFPGTDWVTLYLVFDNENGEYRLRAISKDYWTI